MKAMMNEMWKCAKETGVYVELIELKYKETVRIFTDALQNIAEVSDKGISKRIIKF